MQCSVLITDNNNNKCNTVYTRIFGVTTKSIFPSLILTRHNQKSQLVGGKPVSYLQSVVELTQGLPKTNPYSGQNGI